jgi:prepilin-type N-terminal cleavage/methylation domain-containing protein/prepilin-type processing-associated H-X9-DG protein
LAIIFEEGAIAMKSAGRIGAGGGRGGFGFTLIELLVVVTIIVMLLAILLPSTGRAMMVAEFTVCKSNQHQLLIGTSSYTVSNRGTYPIFRMYGSISALGVAGWNASLDDNNGVRKALLYPFIKNDAVYVCPTYGSMMPGTTRSYSANFNVGYLDEGWNSEEVQKVSAVRSPMAMGYIVEETPWGHPYAMFAPVGANDGQMFSNATGQIGPDGLGTFHMPNPQTYAPLWIATSASDLYFSGISNVGFLDGHVDSRKTSDTQVVIYNNPARVTYNPLP